MGRANRIHNKTSGKVIRVKAGVSQIGSGDPNAISTSTVRQNQGNQGGGMFPVAHAQLSNTSPNVNVSPSASPFLRQEQTAVAGSTNEYQEDLSTKNVALERNESDYSSEHSVERFLTNIGRGAYDTGESYSTDIAGSFTGNAPIRHMKDSTLMDVFIAGGLEGRLHDSLAEVGRRAVEEPGRIIGEVATEAAFLVGTMGAGVALKGVRAGAMGAKVAHYNPITGGTITGYQRTKTGLGIGRHGFGRTPKTEFIGDKTTSYIKTNIKGRVNVTTESNRPTLFDPLRPLARGIEKGAQPVGEQLRKGVYKMTGGRRGKTKTPTYDAFDPLNPPKTGKELPNYLVVPGALTAGTITSGTKSVKTIASEASADQPKSVYTSISDHSGIKYYKDGVELPPRIKKTTVKSSVPNTVQSVVPFAIAQETQNPGGLGILDNILARVPQFHIQEAAAQESVPFSPSAVQAQRTAQFEDVIVGRGDTGAYWQKDETANFKSNQHGKGEAGLAKMVAAEKAKVDSNLKIKDDSEITRLVDEPGFNAQGSSDVLMSGEDGFKSFTLDGGNPRIHGTSLQIDKGSLKNMIERTLLEGAAAGKSETEMRQIIIKTTAEWEERNIKFGAAKVDTVNINTPGRFAGDGEGVTKDSVAQNTGLGTDLSYVGADTKNRKVTIGDSVQLNVQEDAGLGIYKTRTTFEDVYHTDNQNWLEPQPWESPEYMGPIEFDTGLQKGVDQVVAGAFFERGGIVGGYAPKNFLVEGGESAQELAEKYGMVETISTNYAHRTKRNVISSDVTVVFGDPTGKGTALTIETAIAEGKPLIVNPKTSKELNEFLFETKAMKVNFGGTRQSHIDLAMDAKKSGDKGYSSVIAPFFGKNVLGGTDFVADVRKILQGVNIDTRLQDSGLDAATIKSLLVKESKKGQSALTVESRIPGKGGFKDNQTAQQQLWQQDSMSGGGTHVDYSGEITAGADKQVSGVSTVASMADVTAYAVDTAVDPLSTKIRGLNDPKSKNYVSESKKNDIVNMFKTKNENGKTPTQKEVSDELKINVKLVKEVKRMNQAKIDKTIYESMAPKYNQGLLPFQLQEAMSALGGTYAKNKDGKFVATISVGSEKKSITFQNQKAATLLSGLGEFEYLVGRPVRGKLVDGKKLPDKLSDFKRIMQITEGKNFNDLSFQNTGKFGNKEQFRNFMNYVLQDDVVESALQQKQKQLNYYNFQAKSAKNPTQITGYGHPDDFDAVMPTPSSFMPKIQKSLEDDVLDLKLKLEYDGPEAAVSKYTKANLTDAGAVGEKKGMAYQSNIMREMRLGYSETPLNTSPNLIKAQKNAASNRTKRALGYTNALFTGNPIADPSIRNFLPTESGRLFPVSDIGMGAKITKDKLLKNKKQREDFSSWTDKRQKRADDWYAELKKPTVYKGGFMEPSTELDKGNKLKSQGGSVDWSQFLNREQSMTPRERRKKLAEAERYSYNAFGVFSGGNNRNKGRDIRPEVRVEGNEYDDYFRLMDANKEVKKTRGNRGRSAANIRQDFRLKSNPSGDDLESFWVF